MCAIVDILLILIVILFILLIWRGPSMLPQLGEALGKAVKGVRDNVDGGSAKQADAAATPARDDAAAARADAPATPARDDAPADPPRDVTDTERGA
jgi:Sec-independent protein translocase protein TatA